MPQANALVLRRSVVLWVAAFLLMGLNIYAGLARNTDLIKIALALTALFALAGIAFGVWAARKLTHRRT
jgi:LytS/YehU family sensor histidine kinase